MRQRCAVVVERLERSQSLKRMRQPPIAIRSARARSVVDEPNPAADSDARRCRRSLAARRGGVGKGVVAGKTNCRIVREAAVRIDRDGSTLGAGCAAAGCDARADIVCEQTRRGHANLHIADGVVIVIACQYD